jgi:hypothetical protein
MSEHERMTPELQAFEALLAGLEPVAPALDRDRLMYEAGRASMDAAGRRGWPVATLCVGLVALVLGRWTALGPVGSSTAGATPGEPTIVIDQGGSRLVDDSPARAGADPDSWLRLRVAIQRGDIAALTSRPGAEAPTRRPAETNLLEERRLMLDRLN